MPFWAFLHFYEKEKETVIKETVIVSMPFWAFLHFYEDGTKELLKHHPVSMPFWAFLHFYEDGTTELLKHHPVSMPFWAFLHFYSTLLEPAEIKHFPGLFCRYLSENSENKVFQIVFCTVHNLFIF